MKAQIGTFTVGQLISMLQDFPEDMPVMYAYPSGDYWQTEIAGKIDVADIESVKFSDYHRKHVVTEDAEEKIEVVLIRA